MAGRLHRDKVTAIISVLRCDKRIELRKGFLEDRGCCNEIAFFKTVDSMIAKVK